MPSILRYIFSVFALVAFYSTPGQGKDSVRHDFRPSGLRLGTDLISIVRTFSDDSFSGWEVNGDIDFYRYFLTIDAGHWEHQETLDNGTYSNSGNYFRIGVDVNFLPKDPDGNMFFIGARYGRTNFDEQATYTVASNIFGSPLQSVSNQDLTAGWGELTTGLRVKLINNFWLGFTARMKFAPTQFTGVTLQPYDLPGYGLTFKTPWWGFNYQVFYRIPLRKNN